MCKYQNRQAKLTLNDGAALEDSAKVEGYWSKEGMLFPTNMAIVCEAWAA